MRLLKGLLPLIIASGISGITYSVHAQSDSAPEQASATEPGEYGNGLYHPCEFSIDGSVVGILHEYDFNGNGLHRKNYRFGGDAGANFFFTQYIGIGADAYALAQHAHSFVDTATGNLIVRFPIGPVAPYIFGGAGYQFEGVDQIVGGGGVGLEVRLVPHFGIFADARYLAAVKSPDYGLARAGVRLSF
jgi:hypothetical protein